MRLSLLRGLTVALGVLALVSAISFGQNDYETIPAPRVLDRLTISGRVVGPDEKPLAGATVAIVASTDRAPADRNEVLATTLADQQGRFQVTMPRPSGIPLLPSGPPGTRLWAFASAEGHAPAWEPATWQHSNLVLSLPREQPLHGRLIDLQGQPLAGARVYVSRLGVWQASGDPRGMRYRVLSRDDIENDEEGPVRQNDSLFFLTDGTMMRRTQNVKVASRPAVQFLDPLERLEAWPRMATTDAEGRFVVRGIQRHQGVALQVRDDRFGLHLIDIKPPTFVGPPASDEGGTGDLVIALPPARVVEGVVTDAITGKPVPRARLRVEGQEAAGLVAFAVFDLDGAGGADWKGRRNGYGAQRFYLSSWTDGVDGLPAREVQTDEHGRYRLALGPSGETPLQVSGPVDGSYLKRTVSVSWPRGVVRRTLDIALTPGVVVRGKVTDASTGKPIAKVRVDYWSKTVKLPDGVPHPGPVKTAADGTFRLLLPPGPGHLLFNGPQPSYLFQRIAIEELRALEEGEKEIAPDDGQGKGEKPNYRPDGWAALDLKVGKPPAEMAMTLRPAPILKGRLLGPDSKPVGLAQLLRRPPHDPGMGALPTQVIEGQFEIVVHELDAVHRLLFLDPLNRWGAVVEVPGKDAGKGPVTVRLEPCGQARVRFVGGDGKPLVGHRPELWVRLPPGPYGRLVSPADEVLRRALVLSINGRRVRQANVQAPDAIWVGLADPGHYGDGPKTDAEGRCTFSGLIPGATYRIADGTSAPPEFKVRSGQTLELPNVTIREPHNLPELPVISVPK